ncbi:cyclin-dependent kinase inhibitor 1-like isoform X2 [Sinocyclocheilus rhinocerous]|uniref:Cyclin-dependent kinase inhibitor 1-like n=2 Tax=Sinocyclocheilus rhinocerous TaxID=307959 RepID=A0A673MY72_9TELE|nr:PREDICTED: cyclin-dependent kinase inhibitor 1-like isoform X2 [Sinocyclocheilus rhinocerous]
MAMHKRILWALGNGAARRTLFGPVDREQLQLEYRDALRRDLEEASRRWGFDFATETPLVGGDFQWEGVSGVKVPVLYRAGQEEHPSRSGVGKENVPRTPKRYSVLPQNVEKTPEKRTELKRKQTNITDFYLAKKRGVATPHKSGQ